MFSTGLVRAPVAQRIALGVCCSDCSAHTTICSCLSTAGIAQVCQKSGLLKNSRCPFWRHVLSWMQHLNWAKCKSRCRRKEKVKEKKYGKKRKEKKKATATAVKQVLAMPLRWTSAGWSSLAELPPFERRYRPNSHTVQKWLLLLAFTHQTFGTWQNKILTIHLFVSLRLSRLFYQQRLSQRLLAAANYHQPSHVIGGEIFIFSFVLLCLL